MTRCALIHEEAVPGGKLVVRRLVESQDDVDKVVPKFSELTSHGQAFVKSRADERWLASFDRPGAKRIPSD